MHEQNPMPTPDHITCAPLTSSGRVGVVMLGLAVLGWAAPSSAQVPQPVLSELPEVTIEVLVQQVTVLSVQKGQGSMIVDSPPANGGNFMLPTSTQMDAVNINEAGADIPVVRLETNVPISSLHLDFPRRNGFNRGCSESNPGATFFGEAVLLGGNPGNPAHVLGVWPQMARVINTIGDLGPRVQHNCGNAVLTFTEGAPYQNGIHDFAVGVSTRWDNTLQDSGNLFAPPGVYEIEMSLIVVP